MENAAKHFDVDQHREFPAFSHLRLPRSPEDVFFSQLRAETSGKTLLQPQEPGICENIFRGRGEFPYERRN